MFSHVSLVGFSSVEHWEKNSSGKNLGQHNRRQFLHAQSIPFCCVTNFYCR